jgi:hypothetical protein
VAIQHLRCQQYKRKPGRFFLQCCRFVEAGPPQDKRTNTPFFKKKRELVATASKQGWKMSCRRSWNGTGTLSMHLPLTIAVGKCSATRRTASLICGRQSRQGSAAAAAEQSALCFIAWEKQERTKKGEKASYLVGHDGGVGVLDDRRQGAVVVQEHHDMLPLRRRERRLEPRQCRGVTLLRAIDRFQFRQLEQASAQRVQTKKKDLSIRGT